MYLFQFEFVFYRIVSFYYNKLARNGLPMEEWEKELAKRIIQYSRQVFLKKFLWRLLQYTLLKQPSFFKELKMSMIATHQHQLSSSSKLFIVFRYQNHHFNIFSDIFSMTWARAKAVIGTGFLFIVIVPSAFLNSSEFGTTHLSWWLMLRHALNMFIVFMQEWRTFMKILCIC